MSHFFNDRCSELNINIEQQARNHDCVQDSLPIRLQGVGRVVRAHYTNKHYQDEMRYVGHIRLGIE